MIHSGMEPLAKAECDAANVDEPGDDYAIDYPKEPASLEEVIEF